MSFEEIHAKAVRLCEGGVVEFKGHFIRARRVIDGFGVCMECEMDSICDRDFKWLCYECDTYECANHILCLANKKR